MHYHIIDQHYFSLSVFQPYKHSVGARGFELNAYDYICQDLGGGDVPKEIKDFPKNLGRSYMHKNGQVMHRKEGRKCFI